MNIISDKGRDVLNVIAGLLWAVLVITCWIDNPLAQYFGFCVVTCLGVIYLTLGITAGPKIPVVYPILLTAMLHLIAFTIAYSTRGRPAEIWILGLHPGQFWVVLLFWLGTFLTTTLSYGLYFDKYIFPDDTWKDFLKEIEEMKAKTQPLPKEDKA